MSSVVGRFFVLALCALAVVTAWQAVAYRNFLQTPLSDEQTAFDVKRGASLNRVAMDLQQAGLIEHHLQFRFLAWRQNATHRIQAGKYQIPAGSLPSAFLIQLVSGEVEQLRFTIIEGWTLKQLLSALSARDDIVQTLTGDPDVLQQAILPDGVSPIRHWEGQFLPETYYFPSDTLDAAILKRAHRGLQTVLSKAWRERKPGIQVKTPYEALILASIVERETGLVSERAEIAGVFDRRLKKRMKLQTDPTVIYGLGDRYKGNIRRVHLREATPYNTYVIAGLPPTPIAMPGKDAIEAVLHPRAGTSLYFVARGDGSHQFSDSLDEHQLAVRKYQLGK